MAKTELFVRQQAGGMFTVVNEAKTTGSIFWVDSATGTDAAGYGANPDAPFATLSYALSSDVCTASKLDTIYLLPAHTEACIAAGTITADIAGVRIIGLGDGNLKPSITFTTAATASFLVSAANVTIENLIFDLTGVDSLNNPLSITGAGCTVRRCEFEHADATGQADYAIVTAATANDLIVEDCYFFGSGDAGTTAAIHLVGGDSAKIRRNVIVGAYTGTTGGIANTTTPATNLLLADNVIDNRTAGSTKAIIADAATTGIISGNALSVLAGSAPITAAAMVWANNRYAAAAGAVSTAMDTFAVTAATLATDAVDADALATDAVAEIADGAWDEVITGHVTKATTGAAVQPILSGTASAGAAGSITLEAATASATADLYNGCIIQIIGGTGAGQSRLITDYSAGTFVASVAPNWTTTPGATSVYVVRPQGPAQVDFMSAGTITAAAIATNAIDADALATDAVAEIADGIADEALAGHVAAATVGAALAVMHSGTASAGAAGSITLQNTASALADFYNGCVVQIIGGTGVGQTRLITDYAVTTFIASVAPNWITTPGADSVYVVRAVGPAQIDAITAGTIAAVSFAAGAIDATAIANGAIDADTFAADAITNAKIADAALSDEQFDIDAIGKLANGVEVVRATGAVPQTGDMTLFTIAGGRVKLLDIIGEVTTQIGAVANATLLKLNPTGAGATTDLCTAVTINAINVGCLITIDGTLGNPLLLPYDVPIAYQALPLVLPPGTLELECAASDGGTGRVKWVAHYLPLEAGATLVATGP